MKRNDNTDSSRRRLTKHLTYNLNRLPFACAIDRVQEVMGLQPIVSLADAPPFVTGAISVRQKLIPVIDLRRKLGLPARAPNRHNCILLVRVGQESHATLVAVVVDSVSKVVEVDPLEVREVPEISRGSWPWLIAGTARIRGRLTRLIDIDALLTSDERRTITSLAA